MGVPDELWKLKTPDDGLYRDRDDDLWLFRGGYGQALGWFGPGTPMEWSQTWFWGPFTLVQDPTERTNDAAPHPESG